MIYHDTVLANLRLIVNVLFTPTTVYEGKILIYGAGSTGGGAAGCAGMVICANGISSGV
jgi:hypothetical protein